MFTHRQLDFPGAARPPSPAPTPYLTSAPPSPVLPDEGVRCDGGNKETLDVVAIVALQLPACDSLNDLARHPLRPHALL